MSDNHTLGRIKVRAGEILTFTYNDPIPEKPRHITVVAIADIDLSAEMAAYCASLDRSTRDIYTEEALPGFIEHLTEKRLLHIGNEVSVHFGTMRRPASRLMGEYRFKLNPEEFWEDKLIHRYSSNSFTVFNHQNHMLTVMMNVDSPFKILAHIIDMKGEPLGVLRLSVLSEDRHTHLDDNDIERLRMALQADISLNVGEINVLVEKLDLIPCPDFGENPFKRHLTPLPLNPLHLPLNEKGKLDEPKHSVPQAAPSHSLQRAEQPRTTDVDQRCEAGAPAAT